MLTVVLVIASATQFCEVSSCPAGCQCWDDQVFCSLESMTSLPTEGWTKNYTYLRIWGPVMPRLVMNNTWITELFILEMPSLQVFDCSDVILPNLRKFEFWSGKDVREFRCEKNVFAHLQEVTIYKCKNLTHFNKSSWNTPSVKKFSLTYSGVKSLDLADAFPSLTSLKLNGLIVENLSMNSWVLPKLRELQLYGNKHLEHLDLSAVNLPDLENLDAEKGGLKTFNLGTRISTLKSLKLTGNSLTKLDTTGWKLDNLTDIYITNNGMEELFLGGVGIDALWLTGNKISKLVVNASKLTHIMVQNNNLTSLDTSQFWTPKLIYLDASGNIIENVLLAGGIAKLDTVFLQNNRIKALDTSKFNSPGLRFLDLQNNNIRYVNLSGFRERFERLNLANNSLPEFIVAKDFRLKKISTLDLSRNKLVSFDFRGLTELYTLDMSDNMLTEVDLRRLQHLTLNYLGLRNNQMKVINAVVGRSQFVYLYTIDLSGNLLESITMSFRDYRFYHNSRLFLNDNRLKKVLFEGARTYQRWKPLRLENNNLGCFDSSIIDALSPQELYISSSNLTFLDLTGFDNLEVLDVSDNNLKTIHGLKGKVFKLVNLGNNPLWCDCYLNNAYQKNMTVWENATCANFNRTSIRDVFRKAIFNNCSLDANPEVPKPVHSCAYAKGLPTQPPPPPSTTKATTLKKSTALKKTTTKKPDSAAPSRPCMDGMLTFVIVLLGLMLM